MPELVIDNRKIEVPAGTKVIEAAERLGIVIPRFCYHPALGSVGACRVCAVAFVDGPVKGIQMSCMIDAHDGMVVSTTDAEAVDFRRHVIEWLMLHHPHDCPVCDEGGHCLLQDLTVACGHGLRRYPGPKRTHRNQALGPLVQHEMNRCIQCYRCSRYYQEYTGYRDLGVMGIGSRVYFGRSQSGVLESPFAGNLIDICPTGVYTDKPSRYFGRRWDYERQPSVCLHCSLGCNLVVSARYREIVCHEARPNKAVNGHFICDRGRYGYAYASAPQRPRQALAGGSAGPIDAIIAGARQAIERAAARSGPACVAVAAGSRSSLETLAVVKQVCRQHGWIGPAMSHTRREALNLKTAGACLKPELAVSMAEISAADAVVVVGADPINEAPMLALALRQIQRRGGHVTVIDPRGVRLPFAFDHWAVHPADMGALVQALIRQVDGSGPSSSAPALSSGSPATFPVATLARRLNNSPRPVIVCGTDIVTPAEISLVCEFAEALRKTHINVGLFYTLTGANAFAAALIQDPTHTTEQLVQGIEDGAIRVLIAVEADLWRTYPDRERLQKALGRLEHLVVLDYVDSPLNSEAGHFIPTQPLYECGGHWINQEGRLQAAAAVMAGGEPIAISGALDHPPRVFDPQIPGGEPMAAWRAVAALTTAAGTGETQAQLLNASMCDFHPAAALLAAGEAGVRIDLQLTTQGATVPEAVTEYFAAADQLTLLLVDWTFGTEPLSAMAPALSKVEPPPVARLHPDTMARLGLMDKQPLTVALDGGCLKVPAQADARMAPGVVAIPRHHLLDWQVFGETRLIMDSSKLKAQSAE